MMLWALKQSSNIFRMHSRWVVVACALAAGGCTNLPIDGPLSSDLVDQQKEANDAGKPTYTIINLNTEVATRLADNSVPSLVKAFGDVASPGITKIETGDYVTIIIWEVGPQNETSGSTTTSGLMATQQQNVPDQVVAPQGTVAVPYAGRVAIAGLSIEQAEEKIRRSLSGKVMQPQVLVTITRSTSTNVVLSGDDIKGILYPLTPNADRILDVIAAAGGIQSPTYQAKVQVIRDHRSAYISMQKLVSSPEENIHLYPGDALVVSKEPGFITALGALGKNSQIQFASDHMSLAEAVANAGGLLDDKADATGVFIFRFEPKANVQKVCDACDLKDSDKLVPIIYRLDMKRGESFFVAQNFQMVDNDVIYVANSPQVQLEKFLQLIGAFFGPIGAAAATVRVAQP